MLFGAAGTLVAAIVSSVIFRNVGARIPNNRLGVNSFEPYDSGLFSPLEDLSLLSTSTFTTLDHPAFPNYNVRIKRSTDFCDGTVK